MHPGVTSRATRHAPTGAISAVIQCAGAFGYRFLPCYFPLHGYRSRWLNARGKRPIVFSPKQGYLDMPVTVPCGQCIGCRLEKSRQWAMRCVHEAQLHEAKCFITLTYDDVHLPPGGTLVKKHFQDFMKRLRKRFGGNIRYFHCGEYGDGSKRPHYHALLFGVDFSADKKFHNKNPQGQTLWISPTLEQLWGHGFTLIGEFSFETAAYCARYIMKKVTGPDAPAAYMTVSVQTGEIIQREPEYVTMSLKPAIGAKWLEKFSADIYPDDFCIMRGQKVPVPRYYDSVLGKLNAPLLAKLKGRRKNRAKKAGWNNTPERLQVRAEVKESQIKSLKRKL